MQKCRRLQLPRRRPARWERLKERLHVGLMRRKDLHLVVRLQALHHNQPDAE